MMLAVALMLALAEDPAGDAPPQPRAVAPAPLEPQDENDALPAPAPKPDKKAKGAPRLGDPPNRALAAGLTAGSICLAGPSLFCCGGGICCFIPFAMMPACGAAGAAAGLLASGAELEWAPVAAATGIAAGGAVVGIGASIAVVVVVAAATGTNPLDASSLTPAGQTASLIGFGVRGLLTTLITVGAAAGAGAAVYFLMPDDAPAAPDVKGKGSAGGTPKGRGIEARADVPAPSRVAMAF